MDLKNNKTVLWKTQFKNTFIDDVIDQLIENSTLVTLPPNSTVFSIDSRCENYLLVAKGQVKVSLRTVGGSELLLYRVNEGESCILTTTCLMAGKPYPAEGTSETEVVALLTPKKQFEMAMAKSENFRRVVFDHIGLRFSEIISRIESVKFQNLDTRLISELLSLAGADKCVRLTHQELAAEIGASREVISRHLKEFEHQGLIKLGRGCIKLLKPKSLKLLAE